MKKIIYITAVLILCLVLTVSVCAEVAFPFSDGADILTNGEEIMLGELLQAQSDMAGMEISVITVDSYEGVSIESYAEKLCNDSSPGGGILLLVSLKEREYCLTKYGEGEVVFSQKGLAFIEDSFLPYLEDGDYYIAFCIFAQMSSSAISQFSGGSGTFDGQRFDPDISVSSDGTVTVSEGRRHWSSYLWCLLIGVGLGLIPMLIMQMGMKSVRGQRRAESYIIENSLSLRASSDTFLYRTVSKTEKPKSSKSSGRGFGGGSSRSRSGRF